MNLEELRTVQSKERSKDSLQHLRESFYADVADYVADLREQRDRAAERADNPFDDPEVNRLTDEIHTAEEVVEAVYERRVGKVVKRASLAAAGMPADEDGLTSEEQDLFAELVERIEANKQEVLDVLAGDETLADSATATDATPTSGDKPTPSTPSDAGGATTESDVSAADVMGGSDAATDPGGSSGSASTDPSGTSPADAPTEADVPADDPGATGDTDARTVAEAAAVAGGDANPPDGESAGDDRQTSADPEAADADEPLADLGDRRTIRVTDDVGEIFGVDERTYELESEDVVTLPEANAAPLIERGAAEELE